MIIVSTTQLPFPLLLTAPEVFQFEFYKHWPPNGGKNLRIRLHNASAGTVAGSRQSSPLSSCGGLR